MRIHNGLRRLIVNFVSPRARAVRMEHLISAMGLKPGMKVIDLGGVPSFWRFCPIPLDITVVNLDIDQFKRTLVPPHRIAVINGDATDLGGLMDKSFDLAFSNSTIEHVGGPHKRAAFAKEVRRLAPRYYVQTPSIAFPYEVHTGLPFWWFYPASLRASLIARWRRTNPVLAEFVSSTDIVRSAELRTIFWEGTITAERLFGVKKSNTIWHSPHVE